MKAQNWRQENLKLCICMLWHSKQDDA